MRAEERLTPQYDVEAAAPAMAPMRSPDGSDFLSVPGGGEPVVDGSADPSALDRRLARPRMAGDQKQHPFPVNHRPFQRGIDGPPGSVQTMAVQVDDAVRLDLPGTQAAVPMRIQIIGDGCLRPSGRRRRNWGRSFGLASDGRRYRRRLLSPERLRPRQWIARQRTDGVGDLGPEGLLLRGQAAHWPPGCARRCLWAAGSAPNHWPTCRRRCARRRRPRPKRCRSGWRP